MNRRLNTGFDRSRPGLPAATRYSTGAAWSRPAAPGAFRFGDVRELLAEVDDRYVIMNAGDKMRFRFPPFLARVRSSA